jgi:hypothetical protein
MHAVERSQSSSGLCSHAVDVATELTVRWSVHHVWLHVDASLSMRDAHHRTANGLLTLPTDEEWHVTCPRRKSRKLVHNQNERTTYAFILSSQIALAIAQRALFSNKRNKNKCNAMPSNNLAMSASITSERNDKRLTVNMLAYTFSNAILFYAQKQLLVNTHKFNQLSTRFTLG